MSEIAAPCPRLCRLRKRPDFAGYGFNLHAEKGKVGHFVGKVDDGSPAKSAGLREGDRIVEVNGTNIGNENHQQVVQRIKTMPDETTFLVVDPETDAYYKEEKVTVRSDMPNVIKMETPLYEETPKKTDETVNIVTTNGNLNNLNKEEKIKHKLRLCHLKIWPDFEGYGFTLLAQKGTPHQFVGTVDSKSPAEMAGLLPGDQIVEVNGIDVTAAPHQELVKQIKVNPHQVELLVIDKESAEHCTKSGVKFSSLMSTTERITCPDKNPNSATTLLSPTSDISSTPDSTSQNQPLLRLCHVVSCQNGLGFGFNLVAVKGKVGHFIDQVLPGSPADLAGLRSGDHVIEVNGSDVQKNEHSEVVKKIKAIPKETKLLVIDADGFDYFLSKGQYVSGSLPHVDGRNSKGTNRPPGDEECQKKAPLSESSVSQNENKDDDEKLNKFQLSDDYKRVTEEIEQLVTREEMEDEVENAKLREAGFNGTLSSQTSTLSTASQNSVTDAQTDEKQNCKSPVVISGIEFAATAEEARRKMSKKRNVKGASMSIKDKYALYEKL